MATDWRIDPSCHMLLPPTVLGAEACGTGAASTTWPLGYWSWRKGPSPVISPLFTSVQGVLAPYRARPSSDSPSCSWLSRRGGRLSHIVSPLASCAARLDVLSSHHKECQIRRLPTLAWREPRLPCSG